MDEITRKHLTVLWNYMRLGMEPRKSDCIVGFGCYNEDISVRCAELYHQGYAPKVLFTGGLGRNTADMWTRSEAERFADIAKAAGVPAEDIIIENKSTNSAENILFTRGKFRELGMDVSRILAVHKPFMERRLMAAMGVYWSGMDVVYTSPQVDLDTYLQNSVACGMTEHGTICVIVGDFQRMDVYAKKGFQIPQEIPEQCWDAFHALVELGYDRELVQS